MPNKREKPIAVAGEAIGRLEAVGPLEVTTPEGPMKEIPVPAVGPNPTGHTDQALFAHGPLPTGEKTTRGDEGKER